MNDKVIISIDNLSKKYGELSALKKLSFDVKEGECTGLLGPNGAGKSTTIKILTGQLRPSGGSARILNVDPVKNPKKSHDFIAYVPDNQSLYDDITVEENVEFFRRIYKEPKEKTRQILQRVELLEKTKSKVKTLSRGLRQRLLIARTLVHTPKVLFLDEPTTGLDPSATDFICKILEELKQEGVTLLLTTHFMSLAERLCDRIVLLNEGEKKEDGSLVELKKKYGFSQIKVKLLKDGKEETVIFPSNKDFSKKLDKLQKSYEVVSIHTDEAKLEDIFIQIARKTKQRN